MTSQGQPALSAPPRQALEAPAGPSPCRRRNARQNAESGAGLPTSPVLLLARSTGLSHLPAAPFLCPGHAFCAASLRAGRSTCARRCGVSGLVRGTPGALAGARQPARGASRTWLYMQRSPCHHGRWRVPGMLPGWWAQAVVGSTAARQGLQGGGRPQGETDRRQGTSHRVLNSNGYLPTHPRSTAARADCVVVRGAGAAGRPSQDSGVRNA